MKTALNFPMTNSACKTKKPPQVRFLGLKGAYYVIKAVFGDL